MNVRKAMHRAAAKSLDGHCRFVVRVGRSIAVRTLSDLVRYRVKVDIQMAFDKGRPRLPSLSHR
ncbi:MULTISPECIES: hypothetical protein [Paraburkholderia]|jgi:hypothetical protein|uniref:hypothetical protein n=1 Tax=Paraburkholderia TaxID=1822464 RepID=UPI0008A7F550|nr:hypothetical protein [Paraburkholderia hospita]SEI28011.1 hypothetical protein SAMN05192544_110420 [Paraburkholderia hospita]